MVVDRLENLEKYVLLNFLFVKVMEYLKIIDLNVQELGKVKLQGDDLVVNFFQIKFKIKEEVKLEIYNQFIDIQIFLLGVEVMGYMVCEDFFEVDYDVDKDILFYLGFVESYIFVKLGMFVIFFLQDVYVLGVFFDGVKKVIVKVLV